MRNPPRRLFLALAALGTAAGPAGAAEDWRDPIVQERRQANRCTEICDRYTAVYVRNHCDVAVTFLFCIDGSAPCGTYNAWHGLLQPGREVKVGFSYRGVMARFACREPYVATSRWNAETKRHQYLCLTREERG